MKKKTAVIVAAVSLLVAAGLVAAWALGAFDAPPPLSYAPKDADVIAYADLEKIFAHKVGAALKAKITKEQLDELKEKSGFTLDDLLNSEVFVFADSRNFDGKNLMAPDAIVKFNRGDNMPEKLLIELKKNGGDKIVSSGIDGKMAIRNDRGNTLIALNRTMMQISPGFSRGRPRCLTGGGETELAKAVDTSALFSIAFRASDETRRYFAGSPFAVLGDLLFAMANIRERGSDLELEIALTFSKPENAKAAQELLQGLIAAAANACQDADQKRLLESIRIAVGHRKLTASLRESADNVVKLIGDLKEPTAPRAFVSMHPAAPTAPTK